MIFSKLLDDLEIHRDEISFVNLFAHCVASLLDDPCFCTKIDIKRRIRSLLGHRILRFIKTLVQNLKRQMWLGLLIGSISLSSVGQSDLFEFAQSSEDQADNQDNYEDTKSTTADQQNESSQKALIYARVSSHEQVDADSDTEDEGSIDDQVSEARSIADKQGLELAHEPIKDKAQTGTNFDRDGIQKVFQLSKQDEIDYLIVQSVDRIGRSAAQTVYFIDILQNKCSVTLLTSSGEQDTGSIRGLMHTTFLSLMADVQNDIRTTKAKKSKVNGFVNKKNWHCYSPVVPLGYSLTDDGWIECDSSTKSIVEDLFEEFIECETYSETERRIEQKYGSVLEGYRVKTLLQESAYTGHPRVPKKWVSELSYNNEVDDPSLQIISNETFEKAQEIIDDKNQTHSSEESTRDVVDFIEEFDLFSVIESSPSAKLIHNCGTRMRKNGQRTIKGDKKIHLYQCPECGVSRKWPKEPEYDLMELIYEIRENIVETSHLWK